MNIIVTNLIGSTILIIPVVKNNVNIAYKNDNITLETLKGKINIPTGSDLTKISWDSFFPVNKNYPFTALGAESNGWVYVDFFKNLKKESFRIIITNSFLKTIVNMLVTLDDFEITTDNVGDINYSIAMSEFPNGNVWKFTDLANDLIRGNNG